MSYSKYKKKIDKFSYSILGGFFSNRKERFLTLSKKIDQARMPIDYDIYMSRITVYSTIYSLVGLLLGVFVSFLLISTGLMFIDSPVAFPSPVAGFVETYTVQIVSIFICLFLSILFFIFSFALLYYIPFFKANERGRKLDQTLPPAVTYMYALSRGGMNVVDIFETVSKSDDVYGEVSKEFEMIVMDMNFLGSDLQTAISNASETTPSLNMSTFLDDLVGLIDSGGSVDEFLLTKSEQFHEIEKQNQKEFLETLGVLSEAYVTLLVAAPLFVIVITSILTLLGGGGLTGLYVIIYIVMPLATFGFIIIIDIISIAEEDRSSKIRMADHNKLELGLENIEERKKKSKYNKESFEKLIQAKKRYKYIRLKDNPLDFAVENPKYIFGISIPLALLYLILGISSGIFNLSLESLIEFSWYTTTTSFVIPLFISLVPYIILSDIKRKRRKKIKSQLSDSLNKLANANEAGMSLEKGLELVGETSDDLLSKEFEKVAKISKWNTDIKVAMTRMANRLRIPRLSRTIKLITKAKNSSGDITEVLGVAARDAQNAKNFERERKQNMIIYSMIIVLSFVIFVGVLLILQSFFLEEMASIETNEGSTTKSVGSIGFDPDDVPVDKFSMVFYHGAIIQAISSGLMAGKMSNNKSLSGLKWSMIMMLISTLVFIGI